MDEITRNHTSHNIIGESTNSINQHCGGGTIAVNPQRTRDHLHSKLSANLKNPILPTSGSSKLDIISKMRQQEQDRRGAYTSADASRSLYQTSSNKFYSQ